MDFFENAERRWLVYLLVNVKLLWAAFVSLASWWLWPTSYEWWGLAFTSIILAMTAFAALIDAMKDAFRLWRSEEARRQITLNARIAKSNDLVTERVLRDSNVFGKRK